MVESLILDLLEAGLLCGYREELEKESGDMLYKLVKESRGELEKELDEKQLKLVDSHIKDVALREESINFRVSIKLLNYGVKIGMELQKAFDDERE